MSSLSHARVASSQSTRRSKEQQHQTSASTSRASRRPAGLSADSATAANNAGNRNSYSQSPASAGSPSDSAGGASGTGPSHKRTASGSFRLNKDSFTSNTTEGKRKERHTVTTKETLISRARSPEKKSAAPTVVPERTKADHVRHLSEQKPKVAQKETTTGPWAPEVSLRPHTTAPLASRISLPPLASEAPSSLQPTPLHELTLEFQEAAIIEDLLFVFMGYEGQYIRFNPSYDPTREKDRLTGPTYKILPGLDPSLQDLTKSMLKMATHYCAIEAFIEVQSREEFGAVNHALCAAIRRLLQDYLVLIAQLETQFLTNESFTLHVLNIHTLPTNHMLLQMYSLALEILKKNALLDEDLDDSEGDMDDIENILETLRDGGDFGSGNIPGKKICKGGSVLRLITRRLETMSGDPAARTLLTSLLRDASRPYMAMLNEWLHHGGIKDPHAEFLVKEQKSIRRERLEQDYTDEYWERRYTIRESDVPPQLEAVKDKVLLAGKYLNVVRECGGVDVSKEVRDVPRSFDDSRFLDNVNGAYAHANESLMNLLITTHSLPARLRSLKHYFFQDRSEFFSYFLELGSSELKKNVTAVNTSKLQSLLDIVLRQPGSVAASDPFKEDIKVEMNPVTLHNALTRVVNISGIEQGETVQLSSQPTNEPDKNATGMSCLQLDYTVPFPVSLVISRKTVWRYQALFRYLLSLRHLEQQLVECWTKHNRTTSWTHKSSSNPLEMWKRRAWTLRARMLVFVQQLLYFCTAEVIEKNWRLLMAKVKTDDGGEDGKPSVTRTVDELMQDHVDFLDTCLKECMLTNGRLLRIHSKLMQTCTLFATYTNWLSRELEKTDMDLQGTQKPSRMSKRQWERFQAEKTARHPDSTANAATNSTESAARLDKISETLQKYEYNFSRHLQILLDSLNHYAATETVVLLSLCARLSTANQGTQFSGLRNEEDGPA